MLKLTPDQKARKEIVKTELNSSVIRYIILQQKDFGLQFITHTSKQEFFYSQILEGKLGVVNGKTKREWFEHDAIYHGIATKFLTSPLGKFCLNHFDELGSFQSHGLAGETVVNAIQRFFDPSWGKNNGIFEIISGTELENAEIQALILIFIIWLENNVTIYEYDLFKKYTLIKSTQLQKQSAKEKIVLMFPKIPWLNNIESANFRLPNKTKIEEFQKTYKNNVAGYKHAYDTDEVARLLPKAVRNIYQKFEQSEFYKP
jgi:hypothetical protein